MNYKVKNFPNNIKLKFNQNIDEIAMMKDILFSESYAPLGFEIKEEWNIIDIGAHVGAFTIFVAKKAKKGKIYSYEPCSENFKLLKENIKLNKLKNVKIFQLGVFDKKRKMKLFKFKDGSTARNTVYNYENLKDFEVINCISLKEVFDSNDIKFCDFLKIDCEGAEYIILANTPKKYFDKIANIIMEYHVNIHRKCTLYNFVLLLSKVGYKLEIESCYNTLYAKKISSNLQKYCHLLLLRNIFHAFIIRRPKSKKIFMKIKNILPKINRKKSK